MGTTMDTLKDMAGNAALSAAKATKHLAMLSKLRLEILREKERIYYNYAKLGKVYYKDYATDEEPDDAEYKPLCEDISVSFRRINLLRERIAAEKEAYANESPDSLLADPIDDPIDELCDDFDIPGDKSAAEPVEELAEKLAEETAE